MQIKIEEGYYDLRKNKSVLLISANISLSKAREINKVAGFAIPSMLSKAVMPRKDDHKNLYWDNGITLEYDRINKVMKEENVYYFILDGWLMSFYIMLD